MAFEKRTTLPGSERTPPPGSQTVGTIQPDETIRVTLYLRRKAAEPPVASGAPVHVHMTHQQLADAHGANTDDIALVEKFAHEFQLSVVETSIAKRRVVLTGTAAAMSKAFGADLVCYRVEQTGHDFRGRIGALSIPSELQGVVVAVLGLDTRPVAKAHFRRKKQQAPTSFTPPQVAALYSFPTGVTGQGETVAIIELGGGYNTSDLQTYFQGLGVSEPTITAVSVDGGQNTPGSDADGEVMLDIEVVGAISPGANIAVYFAPNTDQGFVDAITDAVHDATRKPSVVSISWGGTEDSWTPQSRNAMNAALQDAATLGVTVTVAAGDDGSTDGAGDGKLHVDFPASSPFALACGGTTLTGSGKKISSEVVWNEIANNEGATGGGVSNVFPVPSYQSTAGVPKQPQTGFVGRGVPDVSGDADPATGYQVRVDGQNQVIGGTSAVAPLWAALVALLNEQLGTPVGFLNPKIYTLGEANFRDITSGTNDDSKLGFYSAKTGWDPCTGLGSPNGAQLLNALSAGSAGAQRVNLPGSTPKHDRADRFVDIADPTHEPVTATFVLRRSSSEGDTDIGQELLSGKLPSGTRDAPAGVTAADQNAVSAVRGFAQHYGMTILQENAAARSVQVQGTAQQMNEAFKIKLIRVTDTDSKQYLTYKGALSIPESLSGIVTAVLGLDTRPVAKHHSSGGQ